MFRKDAVGGERVKRILDGSSSEEEEGGGKVAKLEKPTDFLVERKPEKKKEVR